ncbi:hypothetical protein [Treponema primitia]|uniref:hypothetical protein n=1 Tax=Treponema primitia TaxID=88058 RepID=UPI000255516C|nr:hypothetical protein [Treponema primitia]
MDEKTDVPEYDVDAIVDRVAGAVAAGNYHHASPDEVLLIRLTALEDIVKMYKDIVTQHIVA